jgi:hypothetical protein
VRENILAFLSFLHVFIHLRTKNYVAYISVKLLCICNSSVLPPIPWPTLYTIWPMVVILFLFVNDPAVCTLVGR